MGGIDDCGNCQTAWGISRATKQKRRDEIDDMRLCDLGQLNQRDLVYGHPTLMCVEERKGKLPS